MLEEYVRALTQDQGKPETSREFGKYLAALGWFFAERLDWMVRRFNAQNGPDDELIRRIGPVSIFKAEHKLLVADPDFGSSPRRFS